MHAYMHAISRIAGKEVHEKKLWKSGDEMGRERWDRWERHHTLMLRDMAGQARTESETKTEIEKKKCEEEERRTGGGAAKP